MYISTLNSSKTLHGTHKKEILHGYVELCTMKKREFWNQEIKMLLICVKTLASISLKVCHKNAKLLKPNLKNIWMYSHSEVDGCCGLSFIIMYQWCYYDFGQDVFCFSTDMTCSIFLSHLTILVDNQTHNCYFHRWIHFFNCLRTPSIAVLCKERIIWTTLLNLIT